MGPRVKANIRARKAHRGIFGQQPQVEPAVTGFRHSTKVTTNEEAFAEASSQLALAPPYTGEEQEEMEDNTDKREVNVANGLNVVDDVDVHTKPDAQSFIHLPNLQPVILNSRQDRRSQGPPLPPAVLARIQHITDIHTLPPLPNGARPFGPGPQIYPGPRRSPRVKSEVLRQKQPPVAEERSDIEQGSLLHQLVPAVSTSSSVSSSSSTPTSSSSSPSSSSPQLSAFQALVQQTEKGVSDSPV